MLPSALPLTPEYRDYVWGGQRLRPGTLTAEAWVIAENDRITNGPLAGMTLGEAVERHSRSLLGEPAMKKHGPKFPLLIKILDCFQWLSLQVHPNDSQAVALEGPGKSGKTEAWHIIEAAPDATLIAGLKSGATRTEMEQAIRQGTILDLAHSISVRNGDTILMPAGTLHALGPGLLVYEVQQASDITYRVFDWGRPQTAARTLHIEKSLQVLDPAVCVEASPSASGEDGACRELCRSDYFSLTALQSRKLSITQDTQGQSFHGLTVIDGKAKLTAGDAWYNLNRFESIIIPAATGEYRLAPEEEGFRILKASVC
jgi:mannose-6-phosphate isomerase